LKAIVVFGVMLAVCASLPAQPQDAPVPAAGARSAQAAPAEEEEPEREPVYVRLFSVGLTGSAHALMLLRGGRLENETANPPLFTKFETNTKKHYTAGGITMQLAVLERWTLAVSGLARTAEYESFKTFLAGIDNPKTVVDERVSTGITEKTKARYLDFPVLLRRYNIGRHEYGHRWFIQGGPSLRYVGKIRTERELSDKDGKKTTETHPVAGHRKSLLGVTAGFGGQFIDPVGLRVIPEVRYTRWFGATFDSPPTRSRRDQLEFMISFSF